MTYLSSIMYLYGHRTNYDGSRGFSIFTKNMGDGINGFHVICYVMVLIVDPIKTAGRKIDTSYRY